MDREAKRRMTKRLISVGLRKIAMMCLEEVRTRNYSIGGTKKNANVAAYREMWGAFEPIVAVLERLADTPAAAARSGFQGYDGDPDGLVDPSYSEPDAGKRLRDAFTWVGDEFRRIVRDSSVGSIMLFHRAKTPPPTVLAVQIAEEYARCEPGSRRELFSRLQQFATKAHDTRRPTDETDKEGGGFLDEMS